MLYAVFVATSARASVVELADMLQARRLVLIWLWISFLHVNFLQVSCRYACIF